MEEEKPADARAKAAGATGKDLQMIQSEALERLIERALIRQVVKRAELTATDEEIDGTIADIASENGLTPQQLRESVEAQGLPYSLYRDKIKGEIEHSKVVNGLVGSRVQVSDEEVKEIYDQEMAKRPTSGEEFRIRHILVAPGGGVTLDQACESVKGARARVSAGEDLMEVANGLATAQPDLGWVHERDLAPWLDSAVRPLQAGGLSPVDREPFGCVFVQLVERREVQPITYEQAKRAIQNQIFQQRMQGEYAKFIEDLRAHTYVERKGMFAALNDLPVSTDDEDAGTPGS
jgi:peptidyl-prolyl cis-trans isomerase SurA